MTDIATIRAETIEALAASCSDADEALLRNATQNGQDIDFDSLKSFDSLGAVEVSLHLEDTFDIEIDLAYFVEATTLNAFAHRLAESLQDDAGDATPSLDDKSIVQLQAGQPDAPHLFCISGAGGHVLAFTALAAALPPTVPVYAFKMRGVDGVSTPHGSINAIAADYVDALRRLKSKGGITLLGYSAGGTVAFEMARQLETQWGIKAQLIMIDSLCPTIHSVPVTVRERIGRPGFWRPSKLAQVVAKRVDAAQSYLRHGPNVDEEQARISAHLERGEAIPHDLRQRYLLDAFTRAHNAYRPQPWAGDLAMIQASRKDIVYQREPETLGWGPFISGALRRQEIDADHVSILHEPAVADLANAIRQELEVAA